MKVFQRKYLASLAIACLLMLSLKDSLTIVHNLLHQFPNPFHYHITFTSHDHYHGRGHHHYHTFSDHYEVTIKKSSVAEIQNAEESGKKNQEQKELDSKVDFYFTVWNNLSFHPLKSYNASTHFPRMEKCSSLTFSPPTPPPKISLI